MSLKPAIAYAAAVLCFCAWALNHFPGALQILIGLVCLGALNALAIVAVGIYCMVRRWRIRRRQDRRMGMLLDFNRRMRP